MMVAVFQVVTFTSDYYQVFNVRETTQIEFKRALNQGMIQYANDYYSSDYIAKLEPADVTNLEQLIRTNFVNKLKNDYNLDLTIENFALEDTGVVVCKYKGYVYYRPMIAKRLVPFKIKVHGRSKIQRIDLE